MTITPQQLVVNLESLRDMIARKPADYIPRNDFPMSIGDSFSRYIRTHHVNFILSFSDLLRIEYSWPFPFFVITLCHSKKWQIMTAFPLLAWLYLSVSYKPPGRLGQSAPVNSRIKTNIDQLMVRLVRMSSRPLFQGWLSSSILAEHHQELRELQKVYRKGCWYPTITATFPILDYICRKLLRTENMTKGVGHINKVFSQANISFELLRPGYGAWDYAKSVGADAQELTSNDLRLVGIALESFLQFASVYYGHHDQGQGVSVLNRHAVLHGGRGKVWTKEDATRALLFLDLMVRLYPIFDILLAPSPQTE